MSILLRLGQALADLPEDERAALRHPRVTWRLVQRLVRREHGYPIVDRRGRFGSADKFDLRRGASEESGRQLPERGGARPEPKRRVEAARGMAGLH